MPGLQGRPLEGVVGCVLPACAQGLVEPSSRWLGEGENQWSSFWGLVLLLSILVSALLVSTWIHIRRGHRHRCQRPSLPTVHFPSRGRARWVGGEALAPVTTSPIFQESVFLFPLGMLLKKLCLFSRRKLLTFGYCWICQQLRGEPTPRYRDAYSVGTPLTSRSLESFHHQCLRAVCGVLGYPKGSAAELLDESLNLQFCTTVFYQAISPKVLPRLAKGIGETRTVTSGNLVDCRSNFGKRVR